MKTLLTLLAVVALVCVTDARLAPAHTLLSVGVGMPAAVSDKYHSTDAILKVMADLESTCGVLTKHEVEAVDMRTNTPRKNVAYTLTDPHTPKNNKKRFMLTFGMHGREYISSETALHLARFTCNKTALDMGGSSKQKAAQLVPAPVTEVKKEQEQAQDIQSIGLLQSEVQAMLSQQMDSSRLRKILQTTEIAFVPILNIDGRKKVESGESCTMQRKNGRNVDINRNFADWFDPHNAAPQDEDYQGPSAMSEWESNVVKTLAGRFKPHAFIDVHSGDLGMGFVYGHSGREKTPDDKLNHDWTRGIDDAVFGGKVWSGNLANMGTMPYESHGSSCDYMYKTQGAKIAGTWEIWRKPSFFAQASAQAKAQVEAGSTYDHVSVNVVNVPSVEGDKPSSMLARKSDQNALQVDASVPGDELQALVQSTLGDKQFDEALGLTRDNMQTLIQNMKADGKDTATIQTLLQDMSREQCFAYFNPVLPEHYDNTVSGFALAVLVGAEKLSAPEVAAKFSN